MATGAAGARVAVDARFVHRTNGSIQRKENEGNEEKEMFEVQSVARKKETRLA
jgi:hypothetical protein